MTVKPSPTPAGVHASGAERADSRVLVLERRRGDGRADTLSLLMGQGTAKGVIYAETDYNVNADRLREVYRRAAVRAGGTILSMDWFEARQWVARAILVDRLRAPSTALRPAHVEPWIGDWGEAIDGVTDLFTCANCKKGLPGAWQVALVDDDMPDVGGVKCPDCARQTEPTLAKRRPRNRLAALSRLHVSTGEARRGLALAAQAEAEGVDAADLEAARGEAYLHLSNPVQAALHLRRAVHANPSELRSRALLIESEARCGLVASASVGLDKLLAARPDALDLVQAVRAALPVLDSEAAVNASDLEHRCLQALALLDAGRFDEAMTSFDPSRERGHTHPAARFVAETAKRARLAPSTRNVATQVAELFGESLKLATAALARFVQR
jgi:tetratricopeptide (TPR) repeat protein